MSARNLRRSVLLACLGTMTGATSVLAATGKIQLTAQRDDARSTSLEQALGSLGSTDTGTSSSPTASASPADALTSSTQAAKPDQSQPATVVAKPTPTKSTGRTGIFTGTSVDDGWATFQVQLTVSAGRVTDSQVVGFSPYNGGSRISLVSSYLREEVLTAKSVDCSTVGGATYSCMAYANSLAAAISRAGI